MISNHFNLLIKMFCLNWKTNVMTSWTVMIYRISLVLMLNRGLYLLTKKKMTKLKFNLKMVKHKTLKFWMIFHKFRMKTSKVSRICSSTQMISYKFGSIWRLLFGRLWVKTVRTSLLCWKINL